MSEGSTWRHDGQITVILEPYNSVYTWLREHTSQIKANLGSHQQGLCGFCFWGRIGRNSKGLYPRQGRHYVKLDAVAHRILKLSRDDTVIFQSRRL